MKHKTRVGKWLAVALCIGTLASCTTMPSKAAKAPAAKRKGAIAKGTARRTGGQATQGEPTGSPPSNGHSSLIESSRTVQELMGVPCLTTSAKVTLVLNQDYSLNTIYNGLLSTLVQHWIDKAGSYYDLYMAGLSPQDMTDLRAALANLKAAIPVNSTLRYRDFFFFTSPDANVLNAFKALDALPYCDVPFLYLGNATSERKYVEYLFQTYMVNRLKNITMGYLFTEGIDPADVTNDATVAELVEFADVMNHADIFYQKDIYCLDIKKLPKLNGGGGSGCCQMPGRVCVVSPDLGCVSQNGHCTLITNYCP